MTDPSNDPAALRAMLDRANAIIAQQADEMKALSDEVDRLRLALSVDLGRADRDAIYRHDVKALLADGRNASCHTDIGTALAKLLSTREPACGGCGDVMVLEPEPELCEQCYSEALSFGVDPTTTELLAARESQPEDRWPP